MRQSVLEALLANLGAGQFVGIYAHGSSLKRWRSPIDYVPELSDVDVQVVLRNPELLTGDLDRALAIEADYERRFSQRVPDPLHLPRPQIQVINRELEIPEFLPSPPGCSQTLFGRPINEVRPQPDPAFVVRVDRATLQQTANLEWIAKLPMWLIDRPGKYTWQALRDMAWRVSPTGSRALSALGAGFEEAWGGERTHIVERLVLRGQEELATSYAAFYLGGWAFFLSGYADADSARAALKAGVRVLRIGHEIGCARS